MPKTKTAQDGIFDYGEVKSRLEEYESNPNVLGGGQSDEVGENCLPCKKICICTKNIKIASNAIMERDL